MEIRGGGHSKRLGVATLSGLLAVGLTPAFVTPAFATNGVEGVTVDKAKVTITGKATQTKGSVKDLKDLYQVKITADSGNASKTQCAKIDDDGLTLGYEGDAKTGYTFKTGEKPLEFKAGGSAGDETCDYIIESAQKDSSSAPAGWTAPGTNDKYKLTIKVTTKAVTGGSGSFEIDKVEATKLQTGGASYPNDVTSTGVAFEYAAPGKVTFNAGEGATLDAKDAGGEAAATQIVAPDDANGQAAKKATPSKDSKQTTLYGWKLTETGASDKQHVGKTYRVSDSELKLVNDDGTPGTAYTPVDGDVFEAVWGNKAVFKNKAGAEVTAAPVVFAHGIPTAANDIPGGHADNNGEKPCASPEDFEGWAQVKPSKFPATDADGVKGHLLAAEKGVDYEYQAQCKTYQVAAAFQIKKVGATDITKLGTQTIESGNAPALKFKGDGDTEIDLSTVCGPDHYIKNWTKTTKTDTTGVPVADLSQDKLTFNDTNKADLEGLTYTGECANSQVVFKSSADDLVKNGDVSTLIGANGIAVDIKDGKVNKPEITAGATNTAAHKMLLSWKLTKEAGTAVADGKVFTADLSDTIPATGKAYQPKGGDELTAQWGYEVKYLDGAGNPITTEHVTNGNNPTGKVGGKTVQPVCPEGIATGKWLKGKNLDTPVDGALSTETVNAAPSTSFKSQCVTENLAKISFNVGDGVFKKDTAGNIPNSQLENGVLTVTGVAGNALYMPGAEVLEYKPGFEFKGWAKTKPADQEAAKKTDPVPAVVFPETGKTTEYHAIWVKYDKKITITYKNSSNGLIAVVEGKTINDKNWGPLPGDDTYCSGGQKFKEWQKDGRAFDHEVLEPADLTVDGENAKLELKVACDTAGKPVIWNANGGVIDPKSVNDKVGDKLGKDDKGNETLTHTGASGAKLVAPSVTKKGMKLWGWATNPDATAPERNVPIATVESGTNTVTYYAVWDADDTKPAVPSVTFDANGGKFADGVNPVVEIKDGKVVFEAEPKLEGKVFAGWCTEKPGEDGKCAPEKVFKNEGLKDSVTVYASYVPSFKVTFDLNGGSFAEGVASEAQTDKDGKVAKPADPTLAGKVFSKWCVVPAEGELDEAKCADFDFAKAIDKDTTLKAVYKTAVTVKLQPGIKDAKAVEKPVAEGSKVKELDTTGMCAEGFDFSKWDADDEATVEAGKTYTATCAAHVDKVKVTVKVGTETKSVEVVKGSKLTLEALKTAGVTCGEGQALKLTKADGTVFSLDTTISEAIELTAKCEAKSTPGGSTGGSTGGSSSGGSYFGGGSGGSSTPSTPAKDKKPGDKKPGDKKPGAKQPVVNKFDKQFTKKVELPKSAVKRAAGADRVATSVAALSLAKNHEVVVLATGSNFPDALVGGALAGAYKAGVVLTTGATLEQSVLDSLKSYKTKTVHIVGGNGAVSLAKEAQLRAAGLEVIRHAGADRYATAQAVKAATLKALGGKSAISCNATGSNFPDALACSSAASQMGGVVDLVKPGTAVAKDATAKTVCAGGPACQAAGAGVDKVVGSDRYETAYKLAEMTPAKGSVLVSNGQSYADSLVAGALAGSLQADLVLAKPSRVNVPAGTKSAQLFGGTTVLPDSLSMYTK